MVLFVLASIWSLATPLFTAPDESAQVVRAAAVVRGELVGQEVHEATTAVVIPKHIAEEAIDGLYMSNCYFAKPTEPGACVLNIEPGRAGGTLRFTTYVGHYPPLYYALVGLPTLVTDKTVVVYLMRLVSAALSCALLAAAFCAASRSRRSPLALLGVALAVTPMVLYLAGMVNPAGFEISAAVCVYCTGFTLLGEPELRRSPFLLGWLALSAGLLVQTRGLSPLFLAVAVGTFFAIFGWRPWREVLRSRRGHTGVLFVGACSAFAPGVACRRRQSGSGPAGTGSEPSARCRAPNGLAAPVRSMVPQMFGVFGHVDTPSPTLSIDIWYGALVCIGILAIASRGARRLGVLAGLVLAGIVIPVVITAAQAPRLGFIGQGRDWLPLEVSIPILAAYSALRTSKLERKTADAELRIFTGETTRRVVAGLVVVLVAGLGAAQVLDLVQLIHRYRNGLGNGYNLFGPAKWNPPVPIAALIGVAAVLTAAGCIGLGCTTLRRLAPAGKTDAMDQSHP